MHRRRLSERPAMVCGRRLIECVAGGCRAGDAVTWLPSLGLRTKRHGGSIARLDLKEDGGPRDSGGPWPIPRIGCGPIARRPAGRQRKRSIGSLASLLVLFAGAMVAAPQQKQPAPETEINATSRRSIVDTLLVEFQQRNSNIGWAEIIEVKVVPSRLPAGYIVVARGIRSPSYQPTMMEDELFGVFAVSTKLESLIGTIDVFPTSRLYDFEVRIRDVSRRSLVLDCRGATYGDGAEERKYDLSEIVWPDFQ